MIIETIVTTVALDGTVNCASMGVEWGEESLVLKPFLDTTTCATWSPPARRL